MLRYWHPFILFLLVLISSSALSDQLIIEPDMGRAPILNAIQSAHHSLQLVMYGFTDETILRSLIQQKLSGESVEVMLEQAPYKSEDENNNTIAQLKKAHIAWQGTIPGLRLIHQKTLIMDDQKALVMTFNFTHSSFKNERNFALVIDKPQEVHAISSLFSSDWHHAEPADANTNNLFISPINSRNKLLHLIQQANRSIRIYAQSLSDYKIAGALAKAAKQGVHVDIVTSAHLHPKQEEYLTRAGVRLHVSKSLYIHAKVFIVDNQEALIGSVNLTRSSLDKNRELAVITTDKNIIKQLNVTFDKDMADGHTVKRPLSLLTHHRREWSYALRLIKHYLKNL